VGSFSNLVMASLAPSHHSKITGGQ
jgi:hypothetical protein